MKTIALFLLTLFAVALVAPDAQAGDARITWTLPTQNVDGSAIPATGAGSLTHTRVEWGTCSGTNFGTRAGEQLVAVPALTYTVTNLAPGTWCFRAFARTTYGAAFESVATTTVNKVIATPVPQPPGSFAVEALVAFTVVKQRDSFLLVRVGTVPANTPCSTTQYINGHQVVPRSAVTFDGTVRPEVVVAKCSGA